MDSAKKAARLYVVRCHSMHSAESDQKYRAQFSILPLLPLTAALPPPRVSCSPVQNASRNRAA